MKKRILRMLAATCMATVLLAGMAMTASAAQPDYSKEIEAMDKWLDGLTLTPGSGTSTPSNPAKPSGSVETAKTLTEDELKAYADKVFELVNKEREKAGVSPLEYREDLAEAAQIRAQEIVTHKSHTRPNGEDFDSVMDEFNIERRACGENIYRYQTTPEKAMQGWMDSDGHRRNILKEKYTAIGVGIYQGQDGKLYWTQLFIEEK